MPAPSCLHRFGALLLLAAALALLACPATRGRRGVPEESGFLGDYSQLEPNDDFEAAEVYINPRAQWSQYDSLLIDPVTMWQSSENETLDAEERQMLVDLFFKALHDGLEPYFALVQQPTGGTLRLRAAITEAKGANVPTRTLSTLIPQALVLGTAVGVSADTAKTVGSVTIEAELQDAYTGERLAAAVDDRAGTKALFTRRTFQKWGDVEAAAEYWARQIAKQLTRMGVELKPGATPPD